MCPESKAQSEGAGSAVPVVSRATQLLIEERQKLAGTRQCGPEAGGGGAWASRRSTSLCSDSGSPSAACRESSLDSAHSLLLSTPDL